MITNYNMKKSILTLSMVLLMGAPALSYSQETEYRFFINYDFARGESIQTGQTGGSEAPEGQPETESPITNDPGDPGVWDQYALENNLTEMQYTDSYKFSRLVIRSVNKDSLPGENYPVDTVEEISISDNSLISNIDSLRSVFNVNQLNGGSPTISIVGNPNLENISGLSNINGRSAVNVNVLRNNSLTSLEPLSNISLLNQSSGRGVVVMGNGTLTSLNGIETLLSSFHPTYTNVSILQLVTIKDNINLTDISALSNFPANSSNYSNALTITGNAVVDISPISHITHLRGNLYLNDNEIIDITPLNNILVDGSIDLSNNNIEIVNDLSTVSLYYSTSKIILSNNPINNISGMGGYRNTNQIIIDDREFTVKMDGDSHLCDFDGTGSAYQFESVLFKTGNLGTFAYSDVCHY